MSNPAKAKGTAAETAIVRWARDHGFPGADRQPLRGSLDAGDLTLCPGVIVESKVRQAAGTGQPGEQLLSGWLREVDVETRNARADFGLLVVKRSGTTDVGRWWCYMRLGHFLRLTRTPVDHCLYDTLTDPICMSVASMVAALRANGYGDAAV